MPSKNKYWRLKHYECTARIRNDYGLTKDKSTADLVVGIPKVVCSEIFKK